ncbi:LysR family transcriptional regulator [Marinobacteraceae bacterium S3BR75-40.1]
MNIKLDKLRSFVLVAEEKNLTRAAHRRHTTPSAVSEHLRQLEEELGVVLFERTRKGMTLTDAGAQILVPAQRALAQIGEIGELARSLRSRTVVPLVVGLNAPPEQLKVDHLLQATARHLPEVSLELRTSVSHLIQQQVARGELDLGFVYGDWPNAQLEHLPLAEIQVSVVGPAGHPLRALPTDPAAIRELPWIWPSDACPFSSMMEAYLGGSRAGANIVATSDDEHSTLAMIRAGMGYGLVERSLASQSALQGATVCYEAPYFGINLNLVVRKDRMERLAIMRFVELVRQSWSTEAASPLERGDRAPVGETQARV